MLNPNVIHAQTGKAVPLSDIATTGDIAACPANIAALCMCIAELVKERQLWLEPNEQMVLAGMAQLQAHLLELAVKVDNDIVGHIDPDHLLDDELSDLVVFTLQAMAGKRNG